MQVRSLLVLICSLFTMVPVCDMRADAAASTTAADVSAWNKVYVCVYNLVSQPSVADKAYGLDLLPADGTVFGNGGLPDVPAIEVVIPLGIDLTYSAEGFSVTDGKTYIFHKGTGLEMKQ
jgi:hypothetical protein